MMNRSIASRLGLASVTLVVVLLLPVWIGAQDTPPTIPHPLEGRSECLTCHQEGLAGAPAVPADHAGRTNQICTACHQVEIEAEEATVTAEPTLTVAPTATAEPLATAVTEVTATPGGPPAMPHPLQGFENCLDCHTSSESPAVEAGGPPLIPHPLVGRDNCLACHEGGVGGAPIVPVDHAGRTNETCQGCHQPGQIVAQPTATLPTQPIPTPIVYPEASGVNTCVDCHATLSGKSTQITEDWQISIHAERGVSCADCHGGDPSATGVDASMSPEAGYIGAPAKQDIPALCASCHADVTRMRQYDLPTDQYAKYQESIHGIRLAEGDLNVTTCFDCHGGHKVLKANNPASSVYPANVPELCASCHANKELMAPYGIPTNQYDLYRQSVHGHALLDNQDFRAPNCATCHGTHGAAPPGFQEVANVCGSCHTATQQHYLQSPHANSEAGPKCVTCHGRYDVSKPGEYLYLGSEPRHCGSCHTPDSEPGQVAQALYDNIAGAADAYDRAVEEVEAARRVGMLVAPLESQLREASTDLITARAAQHTLNLVTVQDKTDGAVELAGVAASGAEEAVSESIFRRRAMVVAVAAIALTVGALYLLKRELDRRLEVEG